MANPTGNAVLPPAENLPTTAQKSPKKRDNVAAAVAHGATAASVHTKPRYPIRSNAGNKTATVLGVSSHPRAEDADFHSLPANLASLAAKKSS